MFIDMEKLEFLKKTSEAEALELIRYLEGISYLYVSNKPNSNNIVRIPSKFSNELISKIFNEISGEQPLLIIEKTMMQKICFF